LIKQQKKLASLGSSPQQAATPVEAITAE